MNVHGTDNVTGTRYCGQQENRPRQIYASRYDAYQYIARPSEDGGNRLFTDNFLMSLIQRQIDNAIISASESPENTLCLCLKYWSLKFLANGMFTTSRVIGYTQFMVYMILRVIIAGSICGRIFGSDPSNIQCTLSSANSTCKNGSKQMHGLNYSTKISSADVASYELRMKCAYEEVYVNISPITLWVLGLLPVFIPWFVLLPWTPFHDDQEYIECKPTKARWPCLTIYIVRFSRAFLRMFLEFLCLISVPMWFSQGIPECISCYNDEATCKIEDYREKTYFMWMFTVINAVSLCLTIAELVDICRNKQVYEYEGGTYSSASKSSSIRSSTTALGGITTSKGRKGISKRDAEGPPDQQRRRLGLTRVSDVSLEGKSKFRGRSQKPPEDEMIALACFQENPEENVDMATQLKKMDIEDFSKREKRESLHDSALEDDPSSAELRTEIDPNTKVMIIHSATNSDECAIPITDSLGDNSLRQT